MSASPARTTAESLIASAGAARISILAVDDQPANLVAIESIVDPMGHDLVAVGSGLEALNAVSTREFAAIVLDVTMPGLDGFETLKRLREIPTAQGTPVILLTAHRFDPGMVETRGKPEGGLGLTVAKEIAFAHGGTLSAEVDGKHTRFILTLPREPRTC